MKKNKKNLIQSLKSKGAKKRDLQRDVVLQRHENVLPLMAIKQETVTDKKKNNLIINNKKNGVQKCSKKWCPLHIFFQQPIGLCVPFLLFSWGF